MTDLHQAMSPYRLLAFFACSSSYSRNFISAGRLGTSAMAAPGARKGDLFSWGANSYGQLCCGHKEDMFSPTAVNVHTLPNDILFIVGGGGHTALITGMGELFTCGWNNKGQLGLGHLEDRTELCRVLGLPKVTQVACGWNHTLVVTESGQLFSWGSNAFGQLGTGKTGGSVQVQSPCEVLTGHQVMSITAGLRHSLVVLVDGTVWAWGANKKGQLGLGEVNVNIYPTPERIKSLESITVIQVTAGSHHSACLTDTGSVYCWGSNQYGQCGKSATLPHGSTQVNYPRMVGNALTEVLVRELKSGWSHLLAVSADRRVFTWGRADYGQLGHGEEVSKQGYCCEPKEITCLKGVKQISCGAEHNIALFESGATWTWGWNEHSICGTGDESNVHTPGAVPQLKDARVGLVGCGGGHCFALVVRDAE